MTSKTDIIGIVKEFAERLRNDKCKDHQWPWRLERTEGRKNQPDLAASQLAEALLIAVEALEKIDKVDSGCCGDCCGLAAAESLSRIKSL